MLGVKANDKAEIEKALKFLGDYIIKHFSDEEALQRNAGYPKYAWHREQHQLYISEFNKLKTEYRTNGPSVKYALTLNKSIIDWIVKHVRTADVELGKFLNS